MKKNPGIIFSTIKTWTKKHLIVTDLKPRTVIVLSAISLILAVLPVLLMYFAFVGALNATFLYEEEVAFPTIDIIGILILLLISLTIIAVSLWKIVNISITSVKKRRRLKKMTTH